MFFCVDNKRVLLYNNDMEEILDEKQSDLVERIAEIEQLKSEKEQLLNTLTPDKQVDFLIEQYKSNEKFIKKYKLKSVSEK